MENMVKLGPTPTEMRGEIWDDKLNGHSDLVEIQISHQQDSINSIRFTYLLRDNKVLHSQTHGLPNGSNFDMVVFGTSEVLTSVSGEYVDGRLASIVFGTNDKKSYGPFGRTGSRPSSGRLKAFNYEFKQGRFGGFHGSVADGSVYAIGVYVKPLVLSLVDPYDNFEDDDVWLLR